MCWCDDDADGNNEVDVFDVVYPTANTGNKLVCFNEMWLLSTLSAILGQVAVNVFGTPATYTMHYTAHHVQGPRTTEDIILNMFCYRRKQ
mgnify:CR=1 FL=1